MNQSRLSPSHQTGRRSTFFGVLAMAVALAGATDASAEGKGPKDPKGHQESAKPGEGKGPEHKPGMDHGKPPHGQQVGGAPGMERREGATPDAKKKHFDELSQKEKDGKLTSDEKKELEKLKKEHHDHGRHLGAVKRKARIDELTQKGDKLTDDEKSELARIQKIQSRHEDVDKKAAEKAESRKARSREAKRQALKDAPNVGKDAAATAEYKKHAERLAKLERAKELATADENNDVVQRVDSLIAQEKQRHQNWLTKNQANVQAASEGAGK
jgi:uncharacterized protein YnzC (UPF0291/DUF896 family)